MIDFIRNGGELHEQQETNMKMLDMELKYWGIDKNLFHNYKKDKFDVLQEIMNRPFYDLLDLREKLPFFHCAFSRGAIQTKPQ